MCALLAFGLRNIIILSFHWKSLYSIWPPAYMDVREFVFLEFELIKIMLIVCE